MQTHISSRHSNLNFAHHFLFIDCSKLVNKKQHLDAYQRETIPDKFVFFFSNLVRQKKVNRVSKIHVCYTRNTPGSICQNKEDGLVSRPPSLFMPMRRPMHGTSCPKSQLKSTCLTAKFGSFLNHEETGEKGQNVIYSSVQHLISLIFAIHVSFIIPLPMMWILLTIKAYAEICDHSLFTLQFCYIEK